MQRSGRRGAAWACAALVALAPRVAASQPHALVVAAAPRSGAAPAIDPAARFTALADHLAGLPQAPRRVRALLAGGATEHRTASPAPLPSKAALAAELTRVARASGVRPEHPFAGWFVLEFADVEARDAALAVLASAGSGCVAEAVRGIALAPTPPAPVPAPADDVPGNILQVRAPDAIALVTPDTTLVVAVIDTGSDLTHPDLVRRRWQNDDPPGNATPADDATDQNHDGIVEAWERDDDDDNGYVDDEHGYDFTDAPGKGGVGDAEQRDPDPADDEGHGTHVAGIVCADGSLRGVAPFVQLMTVRAAYSTTFGGVLEIDDAAAAIVYAVDNGARILNLSWGDTQESRLVHEAVEYAERRGVLVIAAAGNGGQNTPHWPSGQAHVLGVGSVDANFATSDFSNFGPGVAIDAPGERSSAAGGGIVSLAPGGGRATRRGTSMAAPHVVGVAAIVMSRADHPDAEKTRALLQAGARRATNQGTALIPGVVDAVGAVQSTDPLRLEVAAGFRHGALTLSGTVTGGDVARWRIDAQSLANGFAREIVAWRDTRAVAETLAVAAFATELEGEWEWVLAVENAHGGRSERRGAFTVDLTPPGVDSLGVAAAWRGPEPRVLLSARLDEPVTVTVSPGGEAAAGYEANVQLECTLAPASARLENAAGLTTVAALPAVDPLPRAWPRGAGLTSTAREAQFRPSAASDPLAPGGAIVWGVGLDIASPPVQPTTVQAWGMAGGALLLRHDTGLAGRPVAAADANGDGAADLLVQTSFRAVWLETSGPGTFPDAIAADIPSERVLGFFQLDADPWAEAILSSRDTLYLYDDATSGTVQRTHVLPNPNRSGFNVFGATAAVGDLDADGRLEIACGDAEGWVAIYEQQPGGAWTVESRLDTDGTYAYEIAALPGTGFLVGRQRTADPGGDDFATAIYDFLLYESVGVPGGWVRRVELPFLAAQNDLRVGITVSPDGRIALVRGTSLGLGRWNNTSFTLDSYVDDADATDGAVGDPPAIVDLDADGALDVVLRTPQGAEVLRLEPTGNGPFDLETESLGLGVLALTWQTRGVDRVRVRRAFRGTWTTLGETTAAVWIDSSAVYGSTFEYEVQAFEGGVPGATTNRVQARSQPLPELVEAQFLGTLPLGNASLRVRCTNPLRAETATAAHWSVTRDAQPIAVLETSLSAGEREVHLVLDAPFECGTTTEVAPVGVRDDQGGRLDALDVRSVITLCTIGEFAVESTGTDGGDVVVRFNQPVDPATVLPQNFTLTVRGTPVPIASADAAGGTSVRLRPATELRSRGDPYRLRIDAALRSASHLPLAYRDLEYAIWVEGEGAANVVPIPNPVRPGDGGVVFAAASATTRIEIYDLQGERVRELSGAVGGGVGWDLRASGGATVAPGTYLYVARDGTSTRTGRVVILR